MLVSLPKSSQAAVRKSSLKELCLLCVGFTLLGSPLLWKDVLWLVASTSGPNTVWSSKELLCNPLSEDVCLLLGVWIAKFIREIRIHKRELVSN